MFHSISHGRNPVNYSIHAISRLLAERIAELPKSLFASQVLWPYCDSSPSSKKVVREVLWENCTNIIPSPSKHTCGMVCPRKCFLCLYSLKSVLIVAFEDLHRSLRNSANDKPKSMILRHATIPIERTYPHFKLYCKVRIRLL